MKYIYSDNLYRIVCKKDNTAFVEKIKAYRKATKKEINQLYLLGENPGYYLNSENSISTFSTNDLIKGNIDIIGTLVQGKVYKINLK